MLWQQQAPGPWWWHVAGGVHGWGVQPGEAPGAAGQQDPVPWHSSAALTAAGLRAGSADPWVLLHALGAGPGCPDPSGVLWPAVCRSCCVPLAMAVCCAGGSAPLWCAVCSAGASWAPTCRCNKAVCAVKGSALRTLLGRVCSPHRDNVDSEGLGMAGPVTAGLPPGTVPTALRSRVPSAPCRAALCGARGAPHSCRLPPHLCSPWPVGCGPRGDVLGAGSVLSHGGGCFPGAFAILRFPQWSPASHPRALRSRGCP